MRLKSEYYPEKRQKKGTSLVNIPRSLIGSHNEPMVFIICIRACRANLHMALILVMWYVVLFRQDHTVRPARKHSEGGVWAIQPT